MNPLQHILNIALIAFVCSNVAIVAAIISTYYQVVKCPDLEGNMINYPEGTKCVNSDQEQEEENKND